MKFRKPQLNEATAGAFYREACERFIAFVPDEFEIVPEGHVCVKWPEGITKGRLNDLAKFFAREGRTIAAGELHALAAIAPEPKKRRVNLWRRFSGEQCWNECESMQLGWLKVAGPIEIDD